jgi:Protein of unknown function (DUF4239)
MPIAGVWTPGSSCASMLAVANWLLGLSVPWLALVVFAATGLITAGIYAIVMALAANERRGLAFKAVSPGMLPPLGLVFGLVVGFIAAQVWSDAGTAQQAVDREASALRAANLVVDQFPEARAARIHALVQSHIRTAVKEEWPAMAEQHETLTGVPPALGAALQVALSLNPTNDGQAVAQRDLVSSLENALDARRQRIIVSQSSVNWVKWTGVILLAALTLLAIAFVHSENRMTAALAMGVFAAAVAVVVVMIAAQDGPFRGQLGVKPTPLEQVAPRAGDTG